MTAWERGIVIEIVLTLRLDNLVIRRDVCVVDTILFRRIEHRWIVNAVRNCCGPDEWNIDDAIRELAQAKVRKILTISNSIRRSGTISTPPMTT